MLSNLIRSLRRKPDNPDYPALFAAAKDAYSAGDFEEAEAAFGALVQSHPHDADAWSHASQCAFSLGHDQLALERIGRARLLAPRSHHAVFLEAGYRAALGEREAARALVLQTLALEPNFSPAYLLWSSIELPGDDYLAFLPRLHRHLNPATYLEIGVFEGRSLQFAGPDTQAIGVDPEPRIKYPVPPAARVLPITSDAFFTNCDVRAAFGGRAVELGFIDGMHLFEHALRDFINMERVSSPDGTILIHDCCPLDRRSAERERHTTFWSGDIWRLILILRKYRPDLRVYTLALAPTGLGMVRGLDPTSQVLAERYDAIVAEYLAMDYSVLDHDKTAKLNLVANSWDDIAALLDAPVPRRGQQAY
jgi:tetratricopeptide (TPR) repeat protein